MNQHNDMINSNVKLKETTYEEVTMMPDTMNILHNGQPVMIVGLGKMKHLKKDWAEVRLRDGIILCEKRTLSWTEGTMYWHLLYESERSYAMKVLRIVLENNYGIISKTQVC